jgi:predicted ATPase
MMRPYNLALLPEALERVGDHDGAVAVVNGVLAAVKGGVRQWEAEFHRLKGTILLSQSNSAASLACFERAMRIARRQKAKSLELRAATSLARLWREQGRRVEARDLLAPAYGWITEGFDTADLKEAKALLDELT